MTVRLYSIGIVARRVGVHPQTLREYERQGLVEPLRTSGGTRRYDDTLIDRLIRVQQLTNEGLSLTGVRYVLGLEDRLKAANKRITELESELASKRAVSVELVHVPRARRIPRWQISEDQQ